MLDPQIKILARGRRDVTSLEGKEPEPVQGVERYWLEIGGLTSMQSMFSGTQLFAQGELWQADVCSLIAPQLSPPCAGVHYGEQGITSLCCWFRDKSLAVLAFLVSLGGVFDSAPSRNCIGLLGDFNAHAGDASDIWGRDCEEWPPRCKPTCCAVIGLLW